MMDELDEWDKRKQELEETQKQIDTLQKQIDASINQYDLQESEILPHLAADGRHINPGGWSHQKPEADQGRRYTWRGGRSDAGGVAESPGARPPAAGWKSVEGAAGSESII